VQVKRHGSAEGWIMVGVGNDQFSIARAPIANADDGVEIQLPVEISALSVRAEEAGRDQLDAIVLRPVALAAPSDSAGVARHAVRYGESNAFFLDDNSYPEPSGFWVAGGRATRVVIAPDRPGAVMPLWLRNGAAANAVTVETGGWHDSVRLLPGEQRRVDVPFTAGHASRQVRIRSTATFRPSSVDPNSHDTRLLGVFVRLTADPLTAQNRATPPKYRPLSVIVPLSCCTL
jgi:hypothetical protein